MSNKAIDRLGTHPVIDAATLTPNRARLAALLLPNSLAVFNTNDVPPTNSDGTTSMIPNSDLFYLTAVAQEETILLIYPQADDIRHREILFLRQSTAESELWEGHKLTREEASHRTGIKTILWLADFPRLFHRLMCETDHVYLNTNEHKRAVIEVESRDSRFVNETLRRYPLHDYQRVAPLMHRLRAIKSDAEISVLRHACKITEDGFHRVLNFTKPGVSEKEIEAEFAHEFIRQGARFAYLPIVASGVNACCLHYVSNAGNCRKGDLLLLDVAAAYSNYNSDLTRTIPVSGRFTRRQKQVYNAVLRVLRQSIRGLTVGKKTAEWQKEAEELIQGELLDLGLLTRKQIAAQNNESPALKKYFMHGVGHPLGLDVHDVGNTTQPMQAGWVMTVEPGIYLREEGFAVRLENNILLTNDGPIDLMATIPIEAQEIEELMNSGKRANLGK